MDNPDGPVSRVGRTFWSVWTYISEAVNRFLRPEPTNTQNSDPIASQRSADNNEPADSGQPEGDTRGGGVDEDQLLAKASLLSSSRPVVAWESCTTEIDLGPVEESTEYKSQLRECGEGKASEESEGLREEQFDKITNDDVELLVAKDASTEGDKEEDSNWKLYSHGQSETPENHEHEEHAKVGPLHLAEDTVSEDIEGGGSRAGAEDEAQEALDHAQEVDETMIQIKERDLDAKDTEVTLYPTTDFSLQDEQSMHTEESRQWRDEEDQAVMHNGAENSGVVLQVVPENEHKYDKGAEQDENVFSVHEELSEKDRDIEEDPSVATLEDDSITFKKRVSVSEDDGQTQVMAQSSESDKGEDEREEEDESTLDLMEQSKEENTSEVADNQEVDEEPEQKEDIKTISENSQSLFAKDVDQFGQTKNDDVELLVAKDASTKEDKEEDSNWKLYSHGQSETPENHEHEEHAKVGPLHLAEDTVSEDIEGGGSRAGAEDEAQEALDHAQEVDETMIQIKERDLDAKDTEVTLYPTTDFSLQDEQSMHTEESRQWRDEEDQAVMHNGAENSGVVLQVVPENEHKYDKGAEQDENVFSVHEELSEKDRDVEEDPSVATLEDDSITFKKRVSVSEDDGQTQVMAQSSESDKGEDEREEEDESTLDLMEQSKEENTSEVADNQEVDEEPEQKEDIKTISENSQSLFAKDVDQFGQTKNDDVELLVAKDASPEGDKEEDSDWKLYSHGQSETPENHEHEEHAKVGPLHLAEDTVSEDIEGGGSRAGAEDEAQEALDHAQEVDSGESGEENNNKIADSQEVEPEQEEEDIQTVSEDSQGDFTEDVRHGEEAVQNGEAKLHTVEIADDEKEDVAEVGTKTRETDAVDGPEIVEDSCGAADISVGDRLCNEDQVGEERLSFDTSESHTEIACTTTSVTVKPIGETGQEIGGELKNTPPRICEGPVVVPQGLTSEETQEGVPGYNNEPEPDENTTQRLLEVGDGNGKEIHATLLPEEEESKEPESTQNSGTRGDYFTLGEHMEELRENTEDIKREQTGILHLTETGLPQKTERLLVEPESEEPDHLFEGEEAKLLEVSMKMGMEHLEKDFETHGGETGETELTAKELRGVTEELLVEFETDEGLNDSEDSAGGNCETTGDVAAEDLLVGFTDDVKIQTMNQTNFFQESADTMNFGQNSNMTHSFLEDIAEESVETEPKLLEDSTVEMQDAGIDMEEPGYGAEEEEVEDEMLNDKQMEFFNPEVTGMATDLTTENTATVLSGESELSSPDESLETKDLPSDEAFEVSKEEILTDTEAADALLTIEFRPKDMTVVESEGSYAEETQSPVSGCQDVIEEEILDLWIETAMSKDNNDMEQEESEPSQQMDTKMEQEHEEQDELPLVQVEEEKEQLVESSSGESGLLTDTEMSSSTTESGFLDQSVSEWRRKHSDTGLFQGSLDVLPSLSESADTSELSEQQPKPESVEPGQADLTGEDSVVETGFHHDSGARSSETEHQIQEVEKSQERTDKEEDESALIKTESQEEMDADVMDLAKRTGGEDTEGTDTETKNESFLKDEETRVKDAPLEVTMSDSADEIQDAESEQSGSGSEASLQDEIMPIASQEYVQTDSASLDKPQPRWSGDIPESPHELNRAEGAEQPTTEYENQTEVDGSTLDFTPQRSRIAVKNPRVRPPKDPRSLLNMPSVDPTPSSRLPVKVPVGVPLGGMGIGIKLPGLGAGFPVLKKTQRGVREEKSSDTLSQEPETKSEEKTDTPKQDEAQRRPKWMPPKQPGFGNPLMSELKSKLKKTTEE